MDKSQIIKVLSEIAILLELKGENPFKIRAYHSAVRALETLEEGLSVIIEAEQLDSIAGIGKALREKIETLYQTGSLEYYDHLKNSLPEGLVELLEIPGLGAKKIKIIYETLGIHSIKGLEQACRAGQIAQLDGFGEKSEAKILTNIANRIAYGKRHLWWHANMIAQSVVSGLRDLKEVTLAQCAGSLRRGMETVGDLDFIVASAEPKPVMEWFCAQKSVIEVTVHGETKSSVRLEGGIQADLRVVPQENFYFALHHFTGSKEHNVKMRQRALGLGYSLSEWGLERKEQHRSPKHSIPVENRDHPVDNEAALFKCLGLNYIAPELREGLDELEASEKNKLPKLIENTDIRGAFHNHTNASDGHDTLEAMAKAADALGWEYLGIADHSQASHHANGLNAERLRVQIKNIHEINASQRFKVHLFTGCECDILRNGDLDLDDTVLRDLDYVVVSVHSAFSQSEAVMTQRILKALEHPCSTMLAHPTGRLLLRREGYAVDMPKIIDAAIEHGKIIELNANPFRLDMDWRLWKKAASKGLLCAINPDAHRAEGLQYHRAGVLAARKGWLEAKHVINTRSLKAVKAFFARNKER